MEPPRAVHGARLHKGERFPAVDLGPRLEGVLRALLGSTAPVADGKLVLRAGELLRFDLSRDMHPQALADAACVARPAPAAAASGLVADLRWTTPAQLGQAAATTAQQVYGQPEGSFPRGAADAPAVRNIHPPLL
jgi:hypothetical protein